MRSLLALTIFLLQSTASSAFSPPLHRSAVANAGQSVRIATPSHCRAPGRYDGAREGRRHRLAAVSIGADDDGLAVPVDAAVAKSSAKKPPFPLVLWRFTRPHTIIGSAIAIPSIFLLAAPTYQSFFTWRSLASLVYASVPSLFMNLYITGLNQITDVDIDKINVSAHVVNGSTTYSSRISNIIAVDGQKPDLPIAKGDLKYSTACAVVLIALAISMAMSVMHPVFSSSGLQTALWGSFLLGTLYSLPPFRMKKHPLLAAFCIVAVRGTIINAGFYSHAVSTVFGSVPEISGVLSCLLNDWKCGLSSLFFGVFGIVIALMKDVPDAHGDRIFNIRSFTVRMGQTRVFAAMKNLLALLFGACGGAMLRWTAMAPATSVAVTRGAVGLACLAAGWSVNKEAKGVNAEDSGEVYSYYMYLWKLFYLSYFALPFIK